MFFLVLHRRISKKLDRDEEEINRWHQEKKKSQSRGHKKYNHVYISLCSYFLRVFGTQLYDIKYSYWIQTTFSYVVPSISFQTFFVQAFKIVVNSWKFSMLLLYILWDDWPMFIISGSNEQLQQHLTKAWLSQLVNFKDAIWTLEERYAIKFCFKLGKNDMWWKLDLLLWPRDQETEFAVEACWLSQTQEGQTEQNHPQTFDDPFFFDSTGRIYMHWVSTGQTVNKEYYVEVLREFMKRFCRKKPALFKSGH